MKTFRKMFINKFYTRSHIVLYVIALLVMVLHVTKELVAADNRNDANLDDTILLANLLIPDYDKEKLILEKPLSDEIRAEYIEKLELINSIKGADNVYFITKKGEQLFVYLSNRQISQEEKDKLKDPANNNYRYSVITRVFETHQTDSFEVQERILGSIERGKISYFITKSGLEYLIAADYEGDSYFSEGIEEVEELFLLLLLIPFIISAQHYFAIEKTKLIEDGMFDELTGLFNRKKLDFLEERIKEQTETHWTIFYFDLDGLKTINDTIGHEAGDAYLLKFVHLLNVAFRKNDIKVRLGGDEFLVVVKNENDTTKDILLQRLEELEEQEQVFFSIGILEFEASKSTKLSKHIKDADKLMYQDKQSRKAKKQSGE